MADYSLVPVEHQPDFENVTLVPVDHDPFGADGVTRLAEGQTAQSQASHPRVGPEVRPQPPQSLTQSQLQSSPLPKPAAASDSATGANSGSPVVDFFNQLAAHELAYSEGVTDLARKNPAATKIEGAIGLGSLLVPPLAIAGAEGFGLFGAGAAAEGLTGSTVAGSGRFAAGSAARRAIAEAQATLPEGIGRVKFGRLAGFEQGMNASQTVSTEATAEIIARLKSAGVSAESIAAFKKIYENVARSNPSNLSAVYRAALLASILRNFQ